MHHPRFLFFKLVTLAMCVIPFLHAEPEKSPVIPPSAEPCHGSLSLLAQDGFHFATWVIVRTKDGQLHYAEGPYTASHQSLASALARGLPSDSKPKLIAGGEQKFRKGPNGEKFQAVFTPASGTIHEMVEYGELEKNEYPLVKLFFKEEIKIEPYNPNQPHLLKSFNIQKQSGEWDNIRHAVGTATLPLAKLGFHGVASNREAPLNNIALILKYLRVLKLEKRLSKDAIDSVTEELRAIAAGIREGKYDQMPGPSVAKRMDRLIKQISDILDATGADAVLQPSDYTTRQRVYSRDEHLPVRP